MPGTRPLAPSATLMALRKPTQKIIVNTNPTTGNDMTESKEAIPSEEGINSGTPFNTMA